MATPRLLRIFAAAALALAALEIFNPLLLGTLEHRLLDAFVRWHAARLAPDPDIVLVDIDDRSLAKMQNEAGKWPWPREVHAQLVEGLAPQKPRAIVFDISFSEKDVFRKQSDEPFAEAVARQSNVYF